MAWARHRDTGELRYILELKETGIKCNCVCISCGQPLTAVNAGKHVFSRRPHFRHPDGMPKDSCVILAARAAMASAFQETEILHLPRRRRHAHVQGFSGTLYEAWVDHPPEAVKIVDVQFADPLRGILTLDDGREIEIRLVGSTNVEPSGNVAASIEIVVNDATIAAMPLEEIRKRIVPLMDEHCWRGHWDDKALEDQALHDAYELAATALDWSELDDLPAEATPLMRRETLLHKLVKDILHASRTILLPPHTTVMAKREIGGKLVERSQEFPARWAELADVALERRLGRIVPDVIATELDGTTLLVEITVTNVITQERRDRIIAEGYPAIEIDIGSMGGTITREGLANLVVNETAAKRWLSHPESIEVLASLNWQLDEEYKREEDLRRAIEQAAFSESLETWVARFLDAATSMFQARQVSLQRYSALADHYEEELKTAGIALGCYGYPEASNPGLYGGQNRILERLLSIRNDNGIGHAESTCWEVINHIRQDGTALRKWHSLYLIAIKVYKPMFSALQEESIAAWRQEVVSSIKAGETLYLRDQIFDRLLALLFPEAEERLKIPQKPPVKTSSLTTSTSAGSPVDRRYSSRNTMPAKLRPGVDYDRKSYWLKGAALEQWKRANPESAKAFYGDEEK